ncbi:MAG: fumarate reductase iron-sulfur subunit, partial [Thermodesulfobacteriota bacterium]
MSRKLTFHVFRYNPLDPSSQPHMQDFFLEETDSLTIFIALNKIREEQDGSLQFDFCCRAGICGSCAMLINGRPDLACHTKTRDLPDEITLLPLPVFKLIGDLSVDTGNWFRAMNEKVESWVHTDKVFDLKAEEERMDNTLAEEIYELERCIECGCCVAACGTANMRPDFIGAVALNRIARFMMDPRDERSEKDYFEV